MRIFEYNDYRLFLKNYIQNLPKRGHGEVSKMAAYLEITQPLMSQILSGDKSLNLEQADLLAEYLQLRDDEKEYLFILVQIERSGRVSLKKYFNAKRDKLKKKSLEISSVISPEKVLTDNERSLFYSSWMMQAIRLLTSIPEYQVQTVQKITKALGLSKRQVEDVLQFLIESGLCIKKNDRIEIGAKSTHLENTSQHLIRHHTNWRLKAIQSFENPTEEERMFTGPMTISRKDYEKIQTEILKLLSGLYKTVASSDAELLVCLNIDFFQVEKNTLLTDT